MDLEGIERLVGIIRKAKISELSVTTPGVEIRLRKRLTAWPHPAGAPSPAAEAAEAPAGTSAEAKPAAAQITAPMVGVFHNHGTSVNPGDTVQVGQVVGFIESMKLMNEVLASAEGVVEDVLVEGGSPVEYGQSLFNVRTQA